MKKQFIRHLRVIAAELGWEAHSHSDGWITEFSREGKRFVVYGFTFPLNNAASQTITRDKVGTAEILEAHAVPTVPHMLILGEETATAWSGVDAPHVGQQLDSVLERFGTDLVLKPNLGMGGRGVVRVRSRAEADAYIREALQLHRDCAASPFVEDAREIRVTLLDDEALLVFEKKVAPGEWLHNLAHGAKAVLLGDPDLEGRCIDLARRACQALDLRLGVVDIFVTDHLQVIEVNGGITMAKMAEQLPEGTARAREIYRKIFQACAREAARE